MRPALATSAILLSAVFGLPQSPATTAPRTIVSIADKWATALAEFVTDPRFHRELPDSLLSKRFLPLIPSPVLDLSDLEASTATGDNPKMGINTMRSNFAPSISGKGFYSLANIHLLIEATDARGTQVLPILEGKLNARLQKPDWSCVADSGLRFWRKRHTHQFVSVNPGAGSSFALDAGKEEGDGEGDESDRGRPCQLR
jgi:hypothetical protein